MAGGKLTYGMVGGGPGAFIGAVHRHALALDGEAVLAAGAFSSRAEASREMGEELGLDPARVYTSYEEMARREAALPENERIDFVVVVTPNHLHVPVATAFVEHGFDVVCDKPLSTHLDDARRLAALVEEKNVVFALTHNYSGYPMVKEARAMVEDGVLGTVRKVIVEYLQGWLSTPVEQTGSKQASWRTTPELAGAGALGDIGTHAEHLARYVTGLGIERVCADVNTFVENRKLDDDASVLLGFGGGAKGVLTCSQIAVGEENRLSLRVYGTEASLEWRQESPNELVVRRASGPREVYTRGMDGLSEAAQRATRVPAGHPEAFIEAFANVYRDALRAVRARKSGAHVDLADFDVPTAQDGIAGLAFIRAVLESSERGGWVDVTDS